MSLSQLRLAGRLTSTVSASRAAAGFILSRRSRVQLRLLRARPMAARASTGRGTKAVYQVCYHLVKSVWYNRDRVGQGHGIPAK
jgi:hypothetical protein